MWAWHLVQVAAMLRRAIEEFGIGVRQDVVRRVAGGAVGRHDQALLQQALAVNALRVVLQDVVLVDVARSSVPACLPGGTCPQTNGTFSGATGERGSFTGRMS